MSKQYKYIILLFLISLCVSCAKKESQPILVNVGDRVVSVEEFLNRAEFTPRPFYCRKSSEIHKKVALNSIIAEKLFALEAGEESQLFTSPKFQAYIKGRKEQYMREELRRQIAEEPVKLDSAGINKTLLLAGHTYNVEFYNLGDTALVKRLQDKLEASPDSAEYIFDSIDLTETVPKRKIVYKDPESPVIHQALYSRELNPGEVVGPLKLQDNQHLIMKVKKVDYTPALTETDYRRRLLYVHERLVERESIILWGDYVKGIMLGKQIQFNPQTALKLAELYLTQLRRDMENKRIDSHEFSDSTDAPTFNNLSDDDVLMNASFFKMDDQTWTVAEFKELVSSHPLVFRKQDIPRKEYLQQFKHAIADLMRDHYVTQEAYAKSIDKSEFVKRNVEMWQDSYLAIYHRKKYLRSLSESENFDEERMRGKYNYIDEYSDSLQEKYSHLININMEEFTNIQLTSTDMFAIQPLVPYRTIVPAFPQLCVDGKLDYLKNELH